MGGLVTFGHKRSLSARTPQRTRPAPFGAGLGLQLLLHQGVPLRALGETESETKCRAVFSVEHHIKETSRRTPCPSGL